MTCHNCMSVTVVLTCFETLHLCCECEKLVLRGCETAQSLKDSVIHPFRQTDVVSPLSVQQQTHQPDMVNYTRVCSCTCLNMASERTIYSLGFILPLLKDSVLITLGHIPPPTLTQHKVQGLSPNQHTVHTVHAPLTM